MTATRRASCLMVQGTASSSGKSLLVTALCRILRKDGHSVAPFKAQNMALNSFVTPDGDEIGRAQAVQAEAAGIPAHVDMNPILLKPEADARCQVVVRGKRAMVLSAGDYYATKDRFWPVIVDSLERLRTDHDVVVIEGAGSPAEVNLKAGDIVNMRVAKLAEAPVLLVGDIDRGGVFASLVGTLELLDPDERELIRGLVINKFRGDPALLEPGLSFLEQRTAKAVLGVIPHIPGLRVADEDSVALEQRPNYRSVADDGKLDVAVVRLPHIANFDDFDHIEHEAGVALRYVAIPLELGRPDLIILPGSKTTIADLAWLRQVGLAAAILELARTGTPIVGICGGFQMLGVTISDPEGVEGATGSFDGLGLLPVATVLEQDKMTAQAKARVGACSGLLDGLEGVMFRGYEIHAGRTRRLDENADGLLDAIGRDAWRIVERSGRHVDERDGLLGGRGWVLGTYVHGLFDSVELRRGMLSNVARRSGRGIIFSSALSREKEYDRLAACVREHLHLRHIYQLLGIS